MSPQNFAKSIAELGPDAPARPRPSAAEAEAYCRSLAKSHYENFTVVSWLLPKRLRQHFANIYAYCRWADDLADETGSSQQSGRLLDWWESQLLDCYRNDKCQATAHPVFVALAVTIDEFQISAKPFLDLISAFRQDQQVTQYATATDVLDYCQRSANPVGRLVLALGRVQDEESIRLSDLICTGLQLANFCQDVANDWDRGRVYLPQETLREVNYTEADFQERRFNAAFRDAMRREVDRAEAYLQAGKPLVDRVPPDIKFDVALFIAGGLAILQAIRKQDYNVWSARPSLGKIEKLQIACGEWLRVRVNSKKQMQSVRNRTVSLGSSYDVCREHSRRAASNFAWAFWVLPKPKRMAMYALYAFLRRTDDLGDNDLSPSHRRADLDAWRSSLARSLAGQCDDPMLPAVADSVRRFSIPVRYLTDVIDGVSMDCVECDPQRSRFDTFQQLEHYCELVASAVGMSCIHIWGFRDQAAFEPARQCGIAFQLTNILRDLKQDADQGRIYLPREDFECVGYAAENLARGVRNERFAALIQLEVQRAEGYYRNAAQLEHYLDSGGRRIFNTMFATYRGLLQKIKRLETGVLNQRVRLSRLQKLRIVGGSILHRPQRLVLDKGLPGAVT